MAAGPRGDPRGGAGPGANGGLGERPFHGGKVTQPTDTPRTRGDLSARPLGYVRHPAHTRTCGRKECPIPAWARYMQASAGVTDDTRSAGLAPHVVQAAAPA
jgi:hypothetical protein